MKLSIKLLGINEFAARLPGFISSILVLIYTFMIFAINRIANKTNKDRMDNTIIRAMANKIAFDAERHRENQEKYNYIKSDDSNE